jgi:hypothetical protein
MRKLKLWVFFAILGVVLAGQLNVSFGQEGDALWKAQDLTISFVEDFNDNNAQAIIDLLEGQDENDEPDLDKKIYNLLKNYMKEILGNVEVKDMAKHEKFFRAPGKRKCF